VILVTIGTSDPFDRLLRAVEALGCGEEIVAQHGASTVRPTNARCVDFLPYDELLELMRRARVVVTHAGAGSVLTAAAAGRKPVCVPRLRRHGEAVDDHQLWFGRRMADAGVLTLVEDEAALPAAVEGGGDGAATGQPRSGTLAREIAAFMETCVPAPPDAA
jgi:UDP-N-acetylglucosamine transferase subunit ALG13